MNSNTNAQYGGDLEGGGRRRQLRRDADAAWIGGVAAGLANYLGIDAAIVRALFVASLLLPGPQVLLYVILWIVIPRR